MRLAEHGHEGQGKDLQAVIVADVQRPAAPVFHRWHHSPPDQGGNKNFAPTFSLWDALFGTFYMPAGRLPQTYGVDDAQFPRGFLGQLIYPFVTREGTAGGLARSLSASGSAIGSAGPQPRS